jgi:two-component system cell cycle response regulator DivK
MTEEEIMGPKILIIEDNAQNLYLTTFILEKHGYEVLPARNGRQGIDLAARVKPALILLDIQLPVMDGYAVARELKCNPGLVDIPIVAVTSYAMVGDRERILAAGCEGYIEKPINPQTFMAQVEVYLLPEPPAQEVDDD